MACDNYKPLEHSIQDLVEYLEVIECSETDNPSSLEDTVGSKISIIKANNTKKCPRAEDETSHNTPKKRKMSCKLCKMFGVEANRHST
eukprot:5490537-Ditylum_brightwellii.AAC.1